MSNPLVLAIADRLLDPAAVTAAIDTANAASLNLGLAGTALLHARLATIDPRFTTAATDHWTEAAAHLRRRPTAGGGIQRGQAALAASLIIGSSYLPVTERLRSTTARSARWLSALAVDIADRHHADPAVMGAPWHVYDAISGLTGVGRVLLAADQQGYGGVGHGLTRALNTLTAILAPTQNPRPGWWLSAEGHPTGVEVCASGAATTGSAHGVAGPLAFLSTAHAAGWSVPGQTDAIANAAVWLLAWRSSDGTWPPHVTGTELDNHTTPRQLGRRDAWCYGTPGITRALHVAAQALGRPEWSAEADHALKDLADRPPSEWDADGPTLCHGHAGVMQATAETNPTVAQAAAAALIDAYDPTTDFGFRHHHKGRLHSQPGFLTGASGVALALAEHADVPTAADPVRWDCLLNLS